MRRLSFEGRGRLEWADAEDVGPTSDTSAVVRPIASTTCDLDRAIIAGRSPFTGPFALDGYRIAFIVGTCLFVAALLVIVILVKPDDSDSEPLEPERRPTASLSTLDVGLRGGWSQLRHRLGHRRLRPGRARGRRRGPG